MKTSTVVSYSAESDLDSDNEDLSPLRCWDCNVNFTSKYFLYNHLFHHIKQPFVQLDRLQLPPLKITFRSRSVNSFEIIHSPLSDSNSKSAFNLEDIKEEVEQNPEGGKGERPEGDEEESYESGEGDNPASSEGDNPESGEGEEHPEENASEVPQEEQADVSFSPNFASVDTIGSPAVSETSNEDEKSANTTAEIVTASSNNDGEYGSIPGAEPTPPPEPSPDYPKIKIKTTGLFKDPSESLTITEITEDNPDGDPGIGSNGNSNMWTTPSLEDPLKLPENDDNILSLFNNNDRAKDLGFSTSENEFISLDRFDERNRGAIQLYNPNNSQNQSPLDSLTGLPMQALAQQVSRLQPSGNGMHQQNVLINIQQFPTGPPQPTYQPPPMYPHYPPQPMHQPYQYQPPNPPMYYPPAPGYPPQHMPPPPQMGQMGQPPMNQPQLGQPQMNQPPMGQPQNQLVPSSQAQNMNQQMQQQPPYRQPMPPRQNVPRQPVPGQRMPVGSRQPAVAQRQPLTRQRAPLVRPRGTGMTAVRGVRPRMTGPQNGIRPQQQSPVKRTPEQMQALQAKKKRLDVLTPSDKDDDDCQVICMQPKNTDGGLPQIESVQGGTSEPAESSIMHLSDSITLSVRNPPPKPVTPQKSDAKAVANILATRGITVTATAKPKEKPDSPQKTPPALPTSLSLNGAVSIVPAAKTNGNSKPSNNSSESLPTVDLTDDTAPPNLKQSNSPQKQNTRPGLPYRCDLCPAQYPNAMGLNKHRQSYHKTTGGMCELGVPLVNLKQPGIMQKLSSLGIQNYIPLPASGPDGMFALPIISTRNPGNVAGIGATQMLSLGPVRSIPKPQNAMVNNMNAAKQLNQKT